VGHRADAHAALQERQHRTRVDPRGLEQLVGDRAPEAGDQRVDRQSHHVEDDPAGQAVPVRVQAGGRQAKHHVAGLHGGAVDDPGALHHTHRKAGQVVLARRVQVRQLGRLAPHQRAAGLSAPLGDPGHHPLDARRLDARGADVVQEVERLGAVHEHVVDPHGDQVDADGVVAIRLEGDLELAADAVGRRDQHRLRVAGRHPDERGEGADAAEDLGTVRAARQRRDAAHGLVAGLDVHPGRAVVERRHGLLRNRRGEAGASARARCRRGRPR
jgi:hypothetical protein